MIKLPQSIIDSDFVINLPVLKTHDSFPVTLGLKNMKGIIIKKDKKRFHLWGLAQCIVDLNRVALPHMTIMDETGYPQGLKGEDMPILSRVILIVDAYEVMITGRPYKKAIGKEEAIAELKKCSGTQFYPELVKRFVKILESKSKY